MPAPQVVWWGLFLTGLAIVIPIIYSWLEKQKIVVEYLSLGTRDISIWIQNKPIICRFLDMIGIQRKAVDLGIRIYIYDLNGRVNSQFEDGYIYGDSLNRMVEFDDIEGRRVHLTPSKTGVSTMVAIAKNGKVFVLNQDNLEAKELPVGFYSLVLMLYESGKREKKGKQFQVNDHSPWIEWSQ